MNSSALSLTVQYALDHSSDDEEGSPLPTEAQLERWASTALDAMDHHHPVELVIRIVGILESHQLNETYRRKAAPTNVLAFPFVAPAELGADFSSPLLGDLVICAPVVAREAQQQQKPLMAHWAHLVIHGTLHLLGFDHEDDASASIMEEMERRLMLSLGHRDPYGDDQLCTA